MVAENFGLFFRELRLGKGMSLRAYCATTGEDPAYISRLERGIIEPPKEQKVRHRLAKSLGLKKGTEEWQEFHRLAAISAGRIPEEILSNEELAKHLPVFFRTISGEKIPESKLAEFIEYVRDFYAKGGEE